MNTSSTNHRKRILVIEDEESFFKELEFALSAFVLDHAKNLKTAATLLRNHNFDLVLLDLNLRDDRPEELEGLEYIPTIRSKYPILPIIIMSNSAGVGIVQKAIQYGANEYFYKPDQLFPIWRNRISTLTEEKKAHETQFPFVGNSTHIQQLKLRLRDKAHADEHLLFQGEVGIGKTTVARNYHKISGRSHQAFMNLDIAYYEKESDVETIFNKIKSGIVYIKAIDTISSRAQAFLYDTITRQKRGGAKADIQFLASSTRDIAELVNEQSFRSDLYFSFTPIQLLPLRNRREDIEVLLDFYLRREANLGIDQLLNLEAKRMLLHYDYPNNISKLIQVVKHGMLEKSIQGKSKIDPDCLPTEILAPNQGSKAFDFSDFRKARANSDLEFVERALRETYGQKGKASKLMGLKPDDMRYMILKHYKDYPDLFADYPSIMNCYKL